MAKKKPSDKDLKRWMKQKDKSNKSKKESEPAADSSEILTSSLLEAGGMFTVTDKTKDSVFSPGSLGFVSFVRGIDESYQDVAKIAAIMTRRGKGGKSRLMSVTICVPVFYVDNEPFDKLLPESGARKYFLHIERNIPQASDILQLDPLSFLGYAVAMSRRIKHMSDQCKHKKWPEAKSNPINVLKRMPDYFEEDSDAMLSKYTNIDFRTSFIEEIRRMSSAMVRVQLQLDTSRANAELNAAEFLLFTNKGEFIPKDAKDKENEYEFTDDNKMLERTIKFHNNLKIEIDKLYEDKRKKKS